MLGFLLQWPTLLTFFMFPILVTMYVRLARWEEQGVRAKFGEIFARYAARTQSSFRGLIVKHPKRPNCSISTRERMANRRSL